MSKKKVALPMDEIKRLGMKVVQRNVMYRRSIRICSNGRRNTGALDQISIQLITSFREKQS